MDNRKVYVCENASRVSRYFASILGHWKGMHNGCRDCSRLNKNEIMCGKNGSKLFHRNPHCFKCRFITVDKAVIQYYTRTKQCGVKREIAPK